MPCMPLAGLMEVSHPEILLTALKDTNCNASHSYLRGDAKAGKPDSAGHDIDHGHWIDHLVLFICCSHDLSS